MSAASPTEVVLVHGSTASGKSTWLKWHLGNCSSELPCLVDASAVWSSWEHGEPEAEIVSAFHAALQSKARHIFIDDVDLICVGSASRSVVQPVSLRLEDLLARILDSCMALGISLTATCTDVQTLPSRLMTPQRFNRVVKLESMPGAGESCQGRAPQATRGLSSLRLPRCMAPPRDTALQDLVLEKQLLEEVRVNCILPLLTSPAAGGGGASASSKTSAASCLRQRPLACNGVLLYGDSGNGKTAAAHAIAHAVRSSGRARAWVVDSAALVSKYVGETESALAAVFNFARDQAPCMLVLDGIDMLVPGSARSAAAVRSSRTWDRVLSTLLTELDGIHSKGSAVALLATASAVQNVDEALRRPGRLGTHVRLPPPHSAMCMQHARQWAAASGTQLSIQCLDRFADRAAGLSHAQVKALLDAAAQARVRAALQQRQALPPAETALMELLQGGKAAS